MNGENRSLESPESRVQSPESRVQSPKVTVSARSNWSDSDSDSDSDCGLWTIENHAKQVELTSKIGWYHIESSMNLLTVLRVAVVAAFAGTAASAAAQAPSPAALTVFAASDLGPAFKQIVPQFERKARARVTLVLGSTGMLAQQIRNGAPADVFFAANETFVTELAAENLTLRQTHSVRARPGRRR